MNELIRVKGNTWTLNVVPGITIPFYVLDNNGIILFDTGYKENRESILGALAFENYKIKAVFNSHVHTDHSGSVKYFQEQGAEIIMSDIEAMVCSSYMTLSSAYSMASASIIHKEYSHMLCKANRVFSSDDDSIQICGEEFKLVHLPGHTAGHTGVITPDNIFFVADAICDEDTLKASKLPSVMDWIKDFETKEKLKEIKADGYILSHKGFRKDISDLIELNTKDKYQKSEQILDALNEFGESCFDDFARFFFKKADMHTSRPQRTITYRRNLVCVLDYLISIGKVEERYGDGVCYYRLK